MSKKIFTVMISGIIGTGCIVAESKEEAERLVNDDWENAAFDTRENLSKLMWLLCESICIYACVSTVDTYVFFAFVSP